MKRAAFVGLGTMGRPMALRLLDAGWDLAVHDIAPAALAPLLERGARPAASPQDAARGAAFVITMLPNGPHVREATMGPQGALAGMAETAVLIDMSTIDPRVSREVAAAAAARHVRMLDAPVSGSSVAAVDGTLTVMVGGARATLEAARPLLAVLGQKVIHCGGAGMGTAVKLANQIMAGVAMVAVSEAFVLAQALGVDPRLLFDVASASSGNCWSLQTRPPVRGVLETSPAERDFAPGFSGDLMRKDLDLALAAAAAAGHTLPACQTARDAYARLAPLGLGTRDFSAVFLALARARGSA